MSAIEIAMDRTVAAVKPAAGAGSLSIWIAERAIQLSEWIAGVEPTAERHPELAGNPWSRPIGLSGRR